MQLKQTWHKLCDIVGLAVYYHPAIVLGVVLRDILAAEGPHLGIFALVVIHVGCDDKLGTITSVAIVVTELFSSSWSAIGMTGDVRGADEERSRLLDRNRTRDVDTAKTKQIST